jgi:hypothetical protein
MILLPRKPAGAMQSYVKLVGRVIPWAERESPYTRHPIPMTRLSGAVIAIVGVGIVAVTIFGSQ